MGDSFVATQRQQPLPRPRWPVDGSVRFDALWVRWACSTVGSARRVALLGTAGRIAPLGATPHGRRRATRDHRYTSSLLSMAHLGGPLRRASAFSHIRSSVVATAVGYVKH